MAPDSEGPERPSKLAIVGIAVVVLLAVAVRQALLASGLVIGRDGTRLLTLATVGFAVLGVALLGGARNVPTLVAGVAATATMFAAAELALPSVESASAPGACPGAQTSGVDFIATTYRNGVSVRAGPSRSFRQLDRLLGNCSVGFVGYCYGDPTLDVFYNEELGMELPDARWLVLPRDRGFIAAGAVRAQEAEDRLGDPRQDCPRRAEFSIVVPQPSLASGATIAGDVTVTAESGGAPIVGFAAYTLVDKVPTFTRLALDVDGSPAVAWRTTEQPASEGTGQGSVVLAVVGCLAAEVPGPHALIALTIDNAGTGTTTTSPAELTAGDRLRLTRTACLLPGDNVPPVVPSEATASGTTP